MLTICCLAYNHENTIRKTIDGFLMQKTNFDYKIIIHDDCSTDGTIDILKEYENKYSEKIKVIYQKENQFSKGVRPLTDFILPMVDSRYIAFCEGDDWWIDEDKLQMQVELLESGDNLSGCFHKTKTLDLSNHNFIDNFYPFDDNFKSKNIFTLEDVHIKGCTTLVFPTSSVVYRFDKYKQEILEYIPRTIVEGDLWFTLFYTLNGNLAYIDKNMSIRTINGNGIWAGKNANVFLQFPNEIISLPIELEKLFKRYNKDSYFSFTHSYENVIKSIIEQKQYDVMHSIDCKHHIEYFKKQQEEKNIYIQKYKRYKKYFKICMFALATIVILYLKCFFLY